MCIISYVNDTNTRKRADEEGNTLETVFASTFG